jgi:hypothetical protein
MASHTNLLASNVGRGGDYYGSKDLLSQPPPLIASETSSLHIFLGFDESTIARYGLNPAALLVLGFCMR